MAKQATLLGVFLVLSASTSPLMAATTGEVRHAPIPGGVTRVLSGAHPEGFGGGSIEPPTDLITDAQREQIRQELDASREKLRSMGTLAMVIPDAHPLLGWPVRLAAGLTDPGYHGISNFVDLNPAFPNILLDYNCGQRTYDTSAGYNHAGSDIFLWPWSWRKMDRKEVEIVAAAPGQIIYKSDGNTDRSCGFNNNNWNAVYVQHADGSVAWYGHMKNGSPTPKQVGEYVARGEYLGNVGSSGNSTGPHLHFEVYDSANHLIEPWFGPCNNLNPESWWLSQRPYYDSAIERVTTGLSAANFPACPTDEIPNARSSFLGGSTIYFTTYYRDQLDTQTSVYTIYRPDGAMYAQWSHSSPEPHYAASWWYWSFGIPSGEMQGTWRFTVAFESQVVERLFTIGAPVACGSVPEAPGQGQILLADKFGASIRLSWGASCNPADSDYVIYEGALGSFSSHSRLTCNTGGALALVVSPGAGSRYWLVGARGTTTEGSLGHASGGAERPVGANACVPRFALDCP